MNRPQPNGIENIVEYTFALSDYCDALEKALDKACLKLDEIAFSNTYNEVYDLTRIYGVPLNSTDWKEWSLKDEKD